jgi:hypothetical protein
MDEEVPETKVEVVNHVSLAVDDIDPMVDVKQFINQPVHGKSIAAAGAESFRQFLFKHKNDLIFHP